MMLVWRVLPVAGVMLFAGLVLSAVCDRDEPAPAPAAGTAASPEARQDLPFVPEMPGPGRDVYLKICTPCHGERGDGVPTARLDSKKFVGSLGEAGLIKAVTEGKGLMPAWSKANAGPLGEEEIADVARYLLAYSALMPEPTPKPLPGAPAPTSEPSEAPAKAVTMVDQGKAFYRANCANCHPQAEDVAFKATPAKVKQKGFALNEVQASAVFEYLRSVAGGQVPVPVPTGAATGDSPPTSDLGAAGPLTVKPPPNVPHRTKGREGRCLECHSLGGVKPFPVNHTGRTNVVCVLCHADGKLPPPVAHEIKGREGQCLGCHAVGGFVPTSATHATRREESCTFCHETTAPGGSATSRVPRIPHLIGTAVCGNCHGSDGRRGIGKRLPPSHSDISDSVCMLCHTLASQPPTPVPPTTPDRARPPGSFE